VGSRRACERLIQGGRVSVNQITVTELGTKVETRDVVKLDGRALSPVDTRVYIALNKPPRFLCSNSDPYGRPLASDLFRESIKERVFHVGRLDYMSSGLILYTNDGEFAHRVAHPSSAIPKVYSVETVQPIDPSLLHRYARGVRIEGTLYKLKDFKVLDTRCCQITLIGGKNREIRRVFKRFGYKLKKIHRIRIGPVTVKGLKSGHFRPLNPKEIDWFRDKYISVQDF
jgi:23S rRNA pseudouridine2605 synthase